MAEKPNDQRGVLVSTGAAGHVVAKGGGIDITVDSVQAGPGDTVTNTSVSE